MPMSPPLLTWKDLLRELTETTSERERLAEALQVHSWTPRRWARGTAKPLERHLRKIPDLFPARKEELIRLIRLDYPDLFPEEESQGKEPAQIPPGYYDRLLKSLSEQHLHGNEPFFYLGLSNLASQIHPQGETWVYLLGFSSTKRSLCTVASMRYEKPHDPLQVQIQYHFLWIDSLVWAGRESIAGQAVMRRQPVQTQREAAYPFLRRGQVAGCLWIIQPEDRGWSEIAHDLLQQYSRLLAIAFLDHEFVAQPDLESLPDREIQKDLLSAYRFQTVSSSLLLEAEEILRKGASYDQPED